MPFDSLQDLGSGEKFHSLPQLEKAGVGKISRLPVSIRVVLESVLRNCDGKKVTEKDVKTLANWEPKGERTEEIPFTVARVLLQDFTGVPLLVDLAAMRSAVALMKKDTGIIEPLVPVDLVIDHSVQVDLASRGDAFERNMEMEFERNQSRYQFLKWGTQAFNGFRVVPPGIGICHQVNLEYLAQCVCEKDGVFYPDTLVGTDSHTTMINGLGIVGWGVGGIEAEAAMLGQPVYFLTPDVVGVHLTGELKTGTTATDLVLRVTEMLRQTKVVGKFVEFYGKGAASLSVVDRATIANMAPEYGATMGFFPVDEATCEYMTATGRDAAQVDRVRRYYKAQGMFGIPEQGQCDYTQTVELDLGTIEPAVAGPKRPQDRIALTNLKEQFNNLLQKPVNEGGYGKPGDKVRYHAAIGRTHKGEQVTGGGSQSAESLPRAIEEHLSHKGTSTMTETEMVDNRPTPDRLEGGIKGEFVRAHEELAHGDVVIAAITSCTNTSNPSVMLAAGLLAKKAVERGLSVRPTVKNSLAPGSRAVTDYLERTGLQTYLNQIGFNLVGYGCTTCIGNSGPLDPAIEQVITDNDLVAAAVLSGNRNFEARVHQNVKANFLMSPPLVVAFALAGRVDVDLSQEPIGEGKDGQPVYLHEIWPSLEEIQSLMSSAFDPESYRRLYGSFADQNPLWNQIPSTVGRIFEWDDQSTYIRHPPYFEGFTGKLSEPKDLHNARPLAIFGDSVTTDHISPAGAIKASSPAGIYLQQKKVEVKDFNSYGSRRGNHEVMVRGTFANVRIKNFMVPGVEGGVTVHYPDAERMSIYDAAIAYEKENVPLIIIAGQEYGTGSSRDWAAKGTRLLGVRAVIAQSFERIHRSNLVGMGVLPCQFQGETPKLDGSETFDLLGLEDGLRPRKDLTLVIHRGEQREEVKVTLRIDTPIEVDYYKSGGILPYVLQQLLTNGG
jgi:aconitate hydratase